MSSRDKVVYTKADHARWRVHAHTGKVTCLCVKSFSGERKPFIRIYSGGQDGSVKIWNGKDGRLITKAERVSGSKITCISYANHHIYIGNQGGQLFQLDSNARLKKKWNAHSRDVTCMQVVNQGRIFSGSLDTSVKLFSDNQELLRRYPKNAEDCLDGICKLQILPGNLILTASDNGCLRIYNINQEILMTIRTASLEGLSLYSTLAISAKNKISIFCGVDNRLVTFYVTKYEENDNQTVIVVDSVKVYKGRIPEGAITDIYPLYVNPLNTKEPTVYLASSCGDIFVYIPTSKIESKYSQHGQFIPAQKFKSYTLKGSSTPLTCIGYLNGKLFAGTSSGNIVMWKEPLNMGKLRGLCANTDNAHPFEKDYSSMINTRSNTVSSTTNIPQIPTIVKTPKEEKEEIKVVHDLIDLSSSLSIDSKIIAEKSNVLNEEKRECSNVCWNCRNNIQDCALYPCGHTCLCYGCGSLLIEQERKCPACNAAVIDCMRVFE